MIATQLFMLFFRFFHIVAGVLWVGSAFLFGVFIGPSAAEVGPSAGPLLHVAVKKRKVAKVIKVLSIVNVAAGWTLWLHDMGAYGGLSEWLGSSFGVGLTIGAVFATAALAVGWYGVGRNVENLVDLGAEIGRSGGTPSPEQGARMASISASLEKFSKIDLALLLVAVTTMSTARYW
ncbi:MAG: hypothetical protein ABI572_12690 [Actinomycetota bacterium]